MRLFGPVVVRLLCVILLAFSLLSACSGAGERHGESASSVIPISAQQTWYLDKLENKTRNATAPDAVTAMLETHLQIRGISSDSAPGSSDAYQLEGEVVQWHYAQGAAMRPVIGLQLRVRDVQSNKILRTDNIDDKGSRRQSLSMLADEMLADYVKALPIVAHNGPTLPASMPMDYLQAVGPMSNVPAAFALRTASSKDSATVFPEPVEQAEAMVGKSVAFFYGPTPPIDELSSFDKVILEPDNIKATELVQLKSNDTLAYAYVSVGEVGSTRAYARDIADEWVLGTNPAWNSQVLDLGNAQLRQFLVQRVGALVKRGYDGVFLDTMDSFNLVTKTDDQRRIQRSGLISLISEFASAYPALSIITNRGFEVLDDIAVHVDAVVAESLYSAWNNEAQRYVSVSENDRQWLLGKLDHVADKLGLDVIVVDYVAPSERSVARQVASRIASHGYIPWVSTPALDYLGIGALEVMPRKVVMLYNGIEEGMLDESDVHRYAAMPLEYLGYVPEYYDVSKDTLPAGVLKGRYAGIISWAKAPYDKAQFRSWLYRQMDDGLPVAFFEQLPLSMDEALAQRMGVKSGRAPKASTASVAVMDGMISPERKMTGRVVGFPLALNTQSADNKVHLRYKDQQGVTADVVLTGEFGGFALTPGGMQSGVGYENYWLVDPFRFIETALKLPRIPQPDITTEGGRRLWLAHVDGDALPSWAEMPGKRLGAEVLYDEIFTKYPLPHTISVVEGEMTGFPRFFDRRTEMFDIARRTFALDHVEIASHTYSHPFYWSALNEGDKSGEFNLPIAGYRYSAEREVVGSIGFIDRQLAPPGKKTSLMLWSGDALPTEAELEQVSRLGLPNMNGGYTAITKNIPSMTLVGSMARPVGKYLQVYAPIMNENVYTDDWQGPFDGFRDVIETFQMTGHPRRIKPINIYYHFYSGTKTSALRALHEVYEWSVAQDIFPVYGSEFSIKVPDFRAASVGRYLDGSWKLSHLGNIRSIRMLGEPRFPQLAASKGISGARQLHDGVYMHTDGRDTVVFKASKRASQLPHLVSSNGRVQHWKASANALEFRVTAKVPVSVQLGGALAASCVLDTANGVVRGSPAAGNTLRFTFTNKDTGNVTLNCPA